MESSYAKNNGSERNILDQMTEGKQLSFYKVCDVCENFLEVLPKNEFGKEYLVILYLKKNCFVVFFFHQQNEWKFHN